MSWEKQFGELVKETEDHLTKARHKLERSMRTSKTASTSTYGDKAYRNGWLDGTSSLPSYRSSVSPVIHSSPSHVTKSYRGVRSHSAPSVPEGAQESNVVAYLSDQVDRQAKVIQELSEKIHRLEIEKERSHTHFHNLEREVHGLRKRVSEESSHSHVEEKLERWNKDIRSQMEYIQGQVDQWRKQSVGMATRESDEQIVSLSQDIHDVKRHLQGDCDALHREVETLRSKMLRHEVDWSSTEGLLRDTKRQLDSLSESFQSQILQMESQIKRLSRVACSEENDENFRDRPPLSHIEFSHSFNQDNVPRVGHVRSEAGSTLHETATSVKNFKDRRIYSKRSPSSSLLNHPSSYLPKTSSTNSKFSSRTSYRSAATNFDTSLSFSDESLSDDDSDVKKPKQHSLYNGTHEKSGRHMSLSDEELDNLESSVSLDSDS